MMFCFLLWAGSPKRLPLLLLPWSPPSNIKTRQSRSLPAAELKSINLSHLQPAKTPPALTEYLFLQLAFVHYHNPPRHRRWNTSCFTLQLISLQFPSRFLTLPPSSCRDFLQRLSLPTLCCAALCCVVAESHGDGPDPIIALLLSAYYLLLCSPCPSPTVLPHLWMLSPAAYGS